MEAYAALVSLINTMEQIMNHPRLSTSLDHIQIESLRERVDFFLDFIEKYNSQGGNQTLESRIASASHEAEDIIESHIVDQIRAGSAGESCCYLPDLERIIQEMDSIKKGVIRVKEEWGVEAQQPSYSVPATTSSRSLTTEKTRMVGFDEELIQLMDVLTREQSSRNVISLVGMGGSGKSTLAKNVYEHSNILQHFDVRAWATISQQYNVKEIIFGLFFDVLAWTTISKKNNVSDKENTTYNTVQEIGEDLHKTLSGRRYLIIIDDVWSTEVWDEIILYFPDNNNGSRVVLTTRLSNIATRCSSVYFRMKFLDENKSWILFCETVFGWANCPLELEGIGREISKQCKGLPLLVVVIGGLLRRSNKTLEYWNYVAENISSVLSSEGNNECSRILYLSYSQLAIHLKPCFLGMAILGEDTEIRASRIIKLWVCEGFIKPNGSQMLEEIAEGYLNDLVDRNLILVEKDRYNRRVKSCRMHDLIRDLCLKVCEEEKFIFSGKTAGLTRFRRLILHAVKSGRCNREMVRTLQSAQLVRSLLCSVSIMPIVFRLCRVLNIATKSSLEAILRNLNLRFLKYKPMRSSKLIPSSISQVWNLQTLVIEHGIFFAPPAMWNLPQLKHVECYQIYLPEPPPNDGQDDLVGMLNLRTLMKAVNLRLSEEVCKRIPNVNKLHLIYDYKLKGFDVCLFDHLHNLGSLVKLRSLKLMAPEYHFRRSAHWLKCIFPRSLEKLTLTNGHLKWKELTVIGSLPQLKALRLEQSVVGQKWEPICGEFLGLNYLTICRCDLTRWSADSSHFPVLKKLSLVGLLHLKEIPSGIADIPTLEFISVERCGESAGISAMEIKEEQEILGNDALQIEVVKGLPATQTWW